MIHVSSEFREQMEMRTDFKEQAEVTFLDGTKLSLTEDDFTVSNNSITDGAGSNGLPLGAAIQRQVQVELMNDDEHLEKYDFVGAKIRLYLTFQLSKSIEKIEYGYFTVTKPETYGQTVIVTAADDMYRADKEFYSDLAFPVSASTLFIEMCEHCGIQPGNTSFRNCNFIIQEKPSGSNLTFRRVFGYLAMLAAGNARISRQGTLEVLSYDFSTFTQENAQLQELRNFDSLKIGTEDVVITGIRMKVKGKTSEEDQTFLCGQEGYILEIDNPLATGQEQLLVDSIGQRLVGVHLRDFSGDHIAYPLAEFMDHVYIEDRKGRKYQTVLTDISFTFFGITTLKNSAVSAIRNSSKYTSEASKTYEEVKKLVTEERKARDTAIENLAKRLESSSGMYCTKDKQPDGSVIYYMHDKPELSDSMIVWKITVEAIGISTDGGKTYPIGLDVSGDAILNRIYVNGIDGKYIKIQDEKLSEYVENINQTATDAKKKAESATNTANKTVAAMSVEYYKSTSATELKGGTWQSGAVTATQGYYIWSRTKTTAQDGTVTYSQAACITGSTGKDGISPTATVSKANGVTTITITDKNGTHTQKVIDGIDGTPGTPGVDGKTSYFHVKYSNDGGKTFTGNSGETVGDWLGTYTDFTKADSTDVSTYTWSKIKGNTGATGKGVKSIVPQYYLSTSKTSQTGGSWSATQPAWQPTHYLWTRSYITWSDNTTSTTTPILAQALNDANEKGYNNSQELETVKKTVTKQGSSLTTMENQIKEKIWKEDITTEIKKISVGGRNLLKGTSKEEQTYNYPSGTGLNDVYNSRVTVPSDKGANIYTLSFWAKSTVNGDKFVTHFYSPSNVISVVSSQDYNGSASDGLCPFTLSTTWTKYWVTYTVPEDGSARTVICPRLYGTERGESNKGTGTLSFKGVKIELGNKATDWTPAPEDVQSGIDTAQSTADNVQTTVTQTRTEVESLKTSTEALTTAMKEYTKYTDFEEYKKQVSSQLSQTPDAIEARFATIEQNVSKVGNASDNKWAQLETYIRFTQLGIALGKSDSPITLEIRNDRICFMQSGQVVAYYTNNQLYNSNLVVTTTANILGLVITKSGRHLRIS